MQIDELAGNTVKITLNPSDMDGYRIKCEDISGDSRTSELALSRLISCLSEDHNLGLCGERLLVEAFPKSDGGCTLYISCLKGTPSGKNASCRPPLTAVICEGELCVLARLCKALKTVADRVSLYADRDGKDYRLASPNLLRCGRGCDRCGEYSQADAGKGRDKAYRCHDKCRV